MFFRKCAFGVLGSGLGVLALVLLWLFGFHLPALASDPRWSDLAWFGNQAPVAAYPAFPIVIQVDHWTSAKAEADACLRLESLPFLATAGRYARPVFLNKESKQFVVVVDGRRQISLDRVTAALSETGYIVKDMTFQVSGSISPAGSLGWIVNDVRYDHRFMLHSFGDLVPKKGDAVSFQVRMVVLPHSAMSVLSVEVVPEVEPSLTASLY